MHVHPNPDPLNSILSKSLAQIRGENSLKADLHSASLLASVKQFDPSTVRRGHVAERSLFDGLGGAVQDLHESEKAEAPILGSFY